MSKRKRGPIQIRTVRIQRRVVIYKAMTKTIKTVGPVYVAFGGAIKEARIALKMRQEELGEKVGLSRASIINIEQGRQRVLLEDIFHFAKALKMQPQKLFDAVRDRRP